MNIATLGLAVDSRPVVSATAALQGLAAAAGPTQNALTRVSAGAVTVQKSLAGVQKQTGLARHELINLSRQAQDVGVSLASGQSPLLVLIQQGTQIADVFASSKGTVGGFFTQLRNAIPVTALLAGGVVAIGAAAYGAFASWKNFALQLDDTAKTMGVTSSEAAKLQAAASFKGIDADEFAKGMQAFSRNVYEAQNGMGSLAEQFRANGVHAKTFNEYLDGAARLIQSASSDQQRLVLLQRLGLPATMEWVRLLSGGAEGLKRAKDAANEFGGAANDQMVAKAREFDEAWNKAWTNFGLSARGAVTSAYSTIEAFGTNLQTFVVAAGEFIGRGEAIKTKLGANSLKQGLGVQTPDNFDSFYSGVGIKPNTTGPDKQTKNADQIRTLIGWEQPRLGLLGTLPAAQQSTKQKPDESKDQNNDSPDNRRAA